MSELPHFQRLLAELKRRRVFRAAAGYGVTAFVVLQVIELLAEGLQLSPTFLTTFTILALAGFPVALVLAWLFERAPQGRLRRTADATSSEIEGIVGQSRLRRWSAGVFALAGAALLVWGAWLVAGRVSGTESRLVSIAVLPLENLTGDPEREYVADGLTEALIGSLGQISGLERVISRTSVMRFKDTDQSLPEIGRALGVNALVEGSVRAYGEQVQIDLRLFEAETEERVWERSFTRPGGDVVALQNEVAMAIAQTVAVQLTATEEARLTRTREVRPQVFDLYLRGLQARGQGVMVQSQTIAFFEQAVAMDPTFAPAVAALAIEYATINRPGDVEALAQEALALNPSLSEAYVALGLMREWALWDWEGAEEAFLQAIAIHPGDAYAHHELAHLRLRQARFDEAIEAERQALVLDPLSPRQLSGLGEILFHAGRYDEAVQQLERVYATNPSGGVTWWLANVNWARGTYDEAMRWVELSSEFRVEALPVGDVELGRARYAALTGDRAEALRLIDTWVERSPDSGDAQWDIATVYADLGEGTQAIDWLERAYESRHGFMIYLKVSPQFAALRTEPRFQALLEKIGLD